jgi:predicted nucleic acid-binding protein
LALTCVWKLSYAMKFGLLPTIGEICGLRGIKRGRITKAHAENFLGFLGNLPIRLVEPSSYDAVFALAEQYGLTVYDAAYLDLALTRGLRLASLDNALKAAAGKSGVSLFQPI